MPEVGLYDIALQQNKETCRHHKNDGINNDQYFEDFFNIFEFYFY